VAFKAFTSSSKNKGKSKKEASSDDEDDFGDEAMALLVRKMGKFMKKKGYDARKRRDHMNDHVRLCFDRKSPNHIAQIVPTRVTMRRMRRRRKIRRKRRRRRREVAM
jgi:hypothetical protein